MAVDPSTKNNNDKSRKHVRNVASVVPVFPLLPSDKKWRKPSVNEIASISKSDISVNLELDDSKTSLPQVSVSHPDNAEVQKDAQESAELDAQTQHPVRTSDALPTNGISDNHMVEYELANGVAQTESPVPSAFEEAIPSVALELHDGDTQIRSRSSTLIPHEVIEGIRTPSNYPVSPLYVAADIVPQSTQIPLTEDDMQGSDPDNTSIHRSNTTGLTDYGSTAGESNLESVTIEPQRPNKISVFHHRQSEVAPEVLLNGYSPSSSRTDKTSQKMNASISSQPPRLPALQEHLLFLASTKSASDLVIQVVQPNRAFPPSVHNVHSLFIMRSPRLLSRIPDYDHDQAVSTRVMNVFPVRNINPHAFEAALRFFYSDQTLTADSLISPQVLRDKQLKVQSLDYIMSYWIAGIELGLEPVKARAYEFFRQVVGWDTAEIVVKEIQDLRRAEETLTDNHDKFEIRGLADIMLSLLSQLFVEGFNIQDFKLDPNAQVTMIPSRMSHLENRSNNPALSAMTFGSLPAQAVSAPSTDSVASAILLNMDFNQLQLLVHELINWHGTLAENILSYLVRLREERRQQIISNIAIPNKDRITHSTAWDVAGWREFIHDKRLNRERVGFLLPTRG